MHAGQAGRTRRRLVALALTVPLLAACTSEGEPEPGPPTEAAPARLTLGTYGLPEAEVTALQTEVERLNEDTTTRSVELTTSDTTLREAVTAGEALPDLFFASNEDLAWLEAGDVIEPVDRAMVERNVDFGDDFSYDGVQAFTVNGRLTCMPFGMDPQVVVYNPDLVDFEAMDAEGLPTPSNGRWDLDRLRAAAEFASDPEAGTKGLYVAPTLDQIAPFVLSGGGSVFAEGEPPTSTALSDEAAVDALTRTLEVLRDPLITLTPDELAQADALEWFTSGRLGMMLAPRSLVPELRGVEGLDFDVIFPPTLDDRATVGTATGICMSAASEHQEAAADTIVGLSSPEVVSAVAEAGYSVPALLEVAASDAFLQPDQLPEDAGVWPNNLRWTYFLPAVQDRAALDEAVAPYLDALLNDAIVNSESIAATTANLDEAARLALGGEAEED
ncbi:extracellular solute-binding protein [Nocardioides zeae]|uniref:Extracellular solute-binding protein n=1 Tax=Nocardioides imazamoxiresistens TaxID=3231893 RepID=A0ABU3PXQ0_9ACTN|nr:extracellular solute-binding protein [Nocardioides zeae]MDT9593939.1 extracellular solute-binding protein [Nocardioides zeae]